MGLFGIEIHDQFLGGGDGMAGEDEALGDFFIFETPPNVHFDFSFDEFGFAGAAHAAFAGIGQIGALVEGGIENGLRSVLGDVHVDRSTVDSQGDGALWSAEDLNGLLFFLLFGLLGSGGEEFEMDVFGIDAEGWKGLAGGFDQGFGSAEETFVYACIIDQ